jgi:hypothetical protein
MESLRLLRGRPASSCARADYYVDRFDQLGVATGAGGALLVAF